MDNIASENYYTAGKNLGLFTLTATLVMTELNTSTLIGFSSLGYIYGNSALSLGMVFLIGLLFYTFVVAKKWKEFDAITVTEFFSQRYGPIFGLLVGICLLIAMLGFGANFIYSITICMQELFPSDYSRWVTSGLICSVMLLFTFKDGLLSIVKIDRLSFVFSLLVFAYLGYEALNNYGFYSNSTHKMTKNVLPLSFPVSLSILTAFTYILSPWYGQKIFAARSTKIAFYSVLFSVVIVSTFYVVAIFVTAKYGDLVSGINPDKALISMVNHLFSRPILFVFYLMLFLIALTTIAALWNTMASICFIHFKRTKAKKDNKYVVLIIAVLSYLVANSFIDHILDKMLLFNIPIAALAFSLLYGFYGKQTNLIGSILSVTVGIVSSFICYLFLDQENFILVWATACIPLSFVFGYLPILFKSR